MSDPTPGTSKATAAVTAALIGGGIAKVVIRVVQHNWPWFLDNTTADVVGTLSVSAVVWVSTYFTPHDVGRPS